MSDNNTNVPADKTDESSSLTNLKPTIHSGKWVKMPISRLKVDFDLNIRFRKGQKLFGFASITDTYDLPTMKLQIIDGVGIQETIDVSERANGDLIVLRGNRRTLAGQELDIDPNTPEAVKAALQLVPVRVFRKLTAEQEMELVEDQGQKPFLRSETVQHVWRLMGKGWSFERVALHLFEQFGKFSGNARKVAEIRALPADQVIERRNAIKKWLRGTLDEYVMPAFKLGPRVMKATLLSEMVLDCILPADSEKPEWITTKDPQKRMAALEKAKKADGSNFNPHTGGPEFNKVIEEFKRIDGGTGIGTPTTTKTRLKMAELNSRAETSRCSAAKMAFRIAAGEVEENFQVRDDFLSLVEAKEGLAMQYIASIKPDTQVSLLEAIRAFIISESVTDFESWLVKHAEPLETTEPGTKEEESVEIPLEATDAA